MTDINQASSGHGCICGNCSSSAETKREGCMCDRSEAVEAGCICGRHQHQKEVIVLVKSERGCACGNCGC